MTKKKKKDTSRDKIEYFQIAALNNAIKTNYIKANIDWT